MPLAVVFSAQAATQLEALYTYVAREANPVTAERYTAAILTYCESLASFPERAPARNDIRPGLRVTHYRSRSVIAYMVDTTLSRIVILGVYYGGQDFVADLQPDE